MNAKRLSLSAAILLAAVVGPIAGSQAGESRQPKGVVELFTSQGCNSCPPADVVLEGLVKSGDVVALGYHVDYWDYLGWKDTLGLPENTARQYDYGKSFGKSSVYTPQAVINGRTDVNGADGAAVTGALGNLAKAGQGLTIAIAVSRSGNSVMIDADGAPGGVGDAHLVLVYFDPMKAVVIDRGENKGRTITYANPVTSVQTAGMWHGKPTRFELPQSEIQRNGGCAVLLQSVSKDGLPGPILGAAMIPQPEG